MKNIFSKKSITDIQQGILNDNKSLKRTLTIPLLIFLAVGSTIGVGLFSITGVIVADYAGPASLISFFIAAIGCGFVLLCYSEFVGMVPASGGAYTYSYVSLGELLAWIIGWDLFLEYSIAAALVASSWSKYVVALLVKINIHIPISLYNTIEEGGKVNIIGMIILVFVGLFLMRGVKESSIANTFFLIVKLIVIITFVWIGVHFFNIHNLSPFIPQNTGTWGHFGWSGVFRASGIIFFAFIGMDALSCVAQETKNPSRAIPISIMYSLLIVTIIYVGFSLVMIGIVNFNSYKGQNALAPIVTAIQTMNTSAHHSQQYDWITTIILIAIVVGYFAGVLISLVGQTRMAYAMSKDGLLPTFFHRLHPVRKSPISNIFFFMIVTIVLVAFVPGEMLAMMLSIGTLFAFIIVCLSVLILRKTSPNTPRPFKTPLVPYIPLAGIAFCLLMIFSLSIDAWIRLFWWLLIGLNVYMFYSMKRSLLFTPASLKSKTIVVSIVSMAVCVVLIALSILTFLNHGIVWMSFYAISGILSVIELCFFSYCLLKNIL